jgi:hypothetical protein
MHHKDMHHRGMHHRRPIIHHQVINTPLPLFFNYKKVKKYSYFI